jgi:hypothetical protein
LALQQLVGPVAAEMMAVAALTEGRRGPSFNHFKVGRGCVGVGGWGLMTEGLRTVFDNTD